MRSAGAMQVERSGGVELGLLDGGAVSRALRTLMPLLTMRRSVVRSRRRAATWPSTRSSGGPAHSLRVHVPSATAEYPVDPPRRDRDGPTSSRRVQVGQPTAAGWVRFSPPLKASPATSAVRRSGPCACWLSRACDWRQGTLHLPETKTGKRDIGVSDEVMAVLGKIAAEKGKPSGAWSSAPCGASGCGASAGVDVRRPAGPPSTWARGRRRQTVPPRCSGPRCS
jgi:hypothetical protein